VRLFETGRDKVKLFVARREGEVLGGHLNFYHRGTVIAWNGVTREDSRGHQAGTALYAACIRDACENGYQHYNLGGSLGKKSLVSYKESLGGVRYEYRVLRWRSLRGKIVAAVKKRIPRR
jgi:CelD/BcsL family acetyltransferase involved in cellulose biosynthesis